MKAMKSACLASVFVGLMASVSSAQDGKSAALAKQLAAALDAAKMDAFAVKDPSGPGSYVGVFYLAGSQMLVVAGNYSAPMLLDARLTRKEYRDAYVDLNSASEPASRFMVEDTGADGLKAVKAVNNLFDAASMSGKRTAFDANWAKQNLSEADYQKAFASADEKYARILQVLVRAVADPSMRVAAK